MVIPRPSSRIEAELKHLYTRLHEIDNAIRSLEKIQRLSKNRQSWIDFRRVLNRAA